MKTPILILAFALAISVSAFAQVPHGIKYQAVARNAFGEVMSEQSIRLRFTVIDSAAGGTSVYTEMFAVETNKVGLFSLLIGAGDKISGDYETIAWATGSKWLKIEMDPTGGTNFYEMGMSEMQSVPYAVVAESSVSDPSSANEVITEVAFDASGNTLSITEAGATKTVSINEEADDLSNNVLNDLNDVDASPTYGQILKWNGLKWVAAGDETNEQTLSLTDDHLSITDGNTVDLTPYLDNTDDQQIFFNPAQNLILLEDGGAIDLTPLVNKGVNVSLSFDSVTNVLTITDGTGSMSATLNISDSDSDTNPTNELQFLSVSGNMLSISNGNTVTLADNSSSNEIQSLSVSGNTLSISGGNFVTLSDNDPSNELITGFSLSGNVLQVTDAGGTSSVDLSGYVNDADADPSNEMQNLGITGNVVSISGGNSVTLSDNDPSNEIQTLSISGDTLSITGGNSVSLPNNNDNDPTNELLTGATLTGTDLNLIDAGGTHTVDLGALVNDADADPANELNTGMSFSSGTLTVSDAGTTFSVDLSSLEDDADADPVNEMQTLSFSNDSLTISSGNSVDLSVYLDNTDAQTLSYANDTITISGGNSIVLNNTDNQTLGLAGDSLSISGGNSVDLSGYLDNTDNQAISLTGNTLGVTNGGSVDLSSYLDNTDWQSLNLAGNTLSISGGNSVNLSGYLDNTDSQAISLTGNTLGVTNGGSVDLSGYLDNTDAQSLNLAGNTLSISGGNSVNLSSYLDNTDAQTLSISGMNLTISSGNTVAIPSSADNLGNHTATQNIRLNGNYISNDGDSEGLMILNNGNVNSTGDFFVGGSAGANRDGWLSGWLLDWDDNTYGIDPNNASTLKNVTVNTSLTVSGTGSFTGAVNMNSNKITNVASPTVGSDAANKTYVDAAAAAQTLTLSGTTLSISGGNSVTLGDESTTNEIQSLSLAGNTLSISGSNSVDLSSYLDNTDAQSLSLAGNNLSISGGNSVSLAGYLDNTDAQSLTYSNDTLYISGGNNVVINSDDDQTLSLSGNTLSIAGGNSVSLSDNNSTNELITSAVMVSDSLKITDAGGTHTVGKFIMSGTTAGGSLTGTYPNPTLVTGAVTQTKIQSNAVTTDKIMDRNVQSSDIDTSITLIGQTTVDGAMALKVKSINSLSDPYTAGEEIVILADASLGALTVVLPPAASVANRVYLVKKTDASGNAVTLNPDGTETIDGVLTPTLGAQYQFMKVISNGTTWYVIGN